MGSGGGASERRGAEERTLTCVVQDGRRAGRGVRRGDARRGGGGRTQGGGDSGSGRGTAHGSQLYGSQLYGAARSKDGTAWQQGSLYLTISVVTS